jgi:hypothetical protein
MQRRITEQVEEEQNDRTSKCRADLLNRKRKKCIAVQLEPDVQNKERLVRIDVSV